MGYDGTETGTGFDWTMRQELDTKSHVEFKRQKKDHRRNLAHETGGEIWHLQGAQNNGNDTQIGKCRTARP